MVSIYRFLIEQEDNIKRTLKNKPKGVSPREWMKIQKDTQFKTEPWFNTGIWGKSEIDGKYYGWSHRAIHGFQKGDKVKHNSMGNWKDSDFVIQSDREAAKTASYFSDNVS